MVHIGSAIRRAHEQKGILHKTVANEVNCTPANYAHALVRSGMTVARFSEICKALGMTMDEVYNLGDQI